MPILPLSLEDYSVALRYVFGFLLIVQAGCVRPAEITSYEVDHEPVAQQSLEKVILLAAMVPDGKDHKWVFKVAGAPEAIDDMKGTFREFLQRLKFPIGADRPTWTVPTRWIETPGNEHREASFRILTPKESLDLSVTKFPARTSPLLANVNRWRGQIGRNPISEAELKYVSEQIEVDGQKADWVEMSGFRSRPREEKVEEGKQPWKVTYDTPTGWSKTVAPLSQVSFFTDDKEEKRALVTLIPLPGPGGGLEFNVRRWRGQVGLDDASPAELEKIRQTKIPVADAEGIWVDSRNPGHIDPKKNRKIGIMFRSPEVPDYTWFITMTGPDEGVESQLDNLKKFAASLRITPEQ